MQTSREHFGSKIGFVLAAAGSAVGIGNLVGFPVNAAKNGGGAFLFVYALFVLLICLPVMMAEMAIGRNTKKEPMSAYGSLGGNNPVWKFAGFLGVLTPFMIAVFYTVITVWVLGYLLMIMSGDLHLLASPDTFSVFINSPYIFPIMAVVLFLVGIVLMAGVKGGIERAAKILMPLLLVMLVALVGFVLTRDNAWAGVEFFLIPDFSKLTPSVVNSAMSQAFFSLSLGMGILITYGSYIDRSTNIVQSAKMVAFTDTAVAFIAGLMILPAIFSFNPDINTSELSDSSIALIFVFLPKIFLALEASLGYFGASCIAASFFLLVFFAAFTSLVSILEVPVSYLMSAKKVNRKQALKKLCWTGGILSLCCAVSFGMVEFFTSFIHYADQNKSFFDVVIDIFYETVLPLNGLLLCLFVSFRWKKQGFSDELSIGNNTYQSSLTQKYINFSLTTFIPLILLLIFVNTVAQKFFAYSLLGF